MLLSNLGQYLGKRYLEIGALVDSEEAVEVLREAVSIARDEHSDKAAALNNLGLELGARYLRTGAIVDLDSAIQHIQEAVSKVSKEDPGWLMYTNNLGLELGDRYLRTGAMVDLEEAIKCIREAIHAAPESHIHSAQLSSNLGIQLSSRYSRTKSSHDLEAAIQTTRRGLDSTPDKHPNRMVQLDNLAILLGYRYRESRDIGDLQHAIQTAQQAVDVAPENHPYKAGLLNNLGDDIGSLYQRTEDITDLEQCIEYLQQAAQLMPLDYPERTALLCNLGDQLRRRHEKIGMMEDRENAINFYLEGLHQSNSYTLSRIRAGRGILRCSTDWQQAHAAASLAVGLVPRLSLRSLQNSDRQHALSQVVGLASDAAAVALHAANTPLVALGLLEEGRGVLGTALEEVRADVLSLQDAKPDLAERFVRLREELETPATQNPQLVGGNPGTTWRVRANRRYEAGKEFDALVDVIRELPGFENFLLPPGEAEIMDAARCGPIAVINVSQYRCDALLVEPHQIRLLPLPDLSLDEIEDRAWGGDLGDYEVLEWLWDTVSQPVLHALGFTDPPTDDAWPHVWWIPTGPLSKFPLHAAGNHIARSGDTVLDRVMSSYASSIKAIIRSRRRRLDPAVSRRALLVAMEHTPGNDALPFAAAEVAMVRRFCAAASIQAVQPGNGKADVESHLPGSAIFHFAGHGATDAHDASNSRILLADGALRVGELLDMNLAAQERHPPPFLAYLSACGTGRIRDEGGVDESLHLMHAFQLAGFRHVVGTLWQVKDELCVDMARIMYEGMAVGGMTDEAVCRGLHFASRTLRDRYLERPGGSEDGTSLSSGVAAEGASTEAQKEVMPLRDVDKFDAGPAPWTPYVHFGV
jgi:tetratricopeptide (TPR) repeat protein